MGIEKCVVNSNNNTSYYNFTIYDEYGDGICCSDHGGYHGYYKLYKDYGNTLLFDSHIGINDDYIVKSFIFDVDDFDELSLSPTTTNNVEFSLQPTISSLQPTFNNTTPNSTPS